MLKTIYPNSVLFCFFMWSATLQIFESLKAHFLKWLSFYISQAWHISKKTSLYKDISKQLFLNYSQLILSQTQVSWLWHCSSEPSELAENFQEIFFINSKLFSRVLAAYKVKEANSTQTSNCSGLVSWFKEFDSGTWMVPIILDTKVSLIGDFWVVSTIPEK